MRVQVAGRQMDVGEALRTRIEGELASGVGKYFNRATDAVVTVGKNGAAGVDVDCTVHLSSGISLQAQGHGGDAHLAFDNALTKLEKRVRRYKRRLRNHHGEGREPLPWQDAGAYVLAPLEDETDAEANGDVGQGTTAKEEGPLVIAETTVPVRTMTVSMAVMQLDLADAPALMFRNAAHGGLNLVYRRADGNVGWVDPDRGPNHGGGAKKPNGSAA